MNFSKKRKRINEMSPAAYREKLGNLVPEVVRATLAAGDISSGKATVALSEPIGRPLCSLLVASSAGAVRAVTAAVVGATSVQITATGVAAGDTVTMMFL